MNTAPRPIKQDSLNPSAHPVILVLDSGVGGLSVCRSIHTLCPEIRQVYVADDAFFPYGTKSEQELMARLIELCTRLIPVYQPELVVLACNTVSTLVLPELRGRFSVPFVGVVPAIKPAAQLSESKHIGLLATPATIGRPYIDQLIEEFASECVVTRVGSRELVFEAEKLFRGETTDDEDIKRVLAPFMSRPDLDTVVLGCTHFPLLQSQLEQCLPGIQWVDSGAAIARRVQSLLHERLSKEDIHPGPQHQVCFSAKLPEQSSFINYLHQLGFENISLGLI